ncbi:MAG: hypothetical protein Edafosvirus2_70 [Edafosvirus sp.]|uniref:TRAF-type domain-containing protein n=1 Tax=Edafosvirus sp. TaxID=2487765 RepID=A0A3G4ZV73_9VIRU|nr:MAG: hypothetical protein Edafosvirus2_70 [Edafosvirus sp.]
MQADPQISSCPGCNKVDVTDDHIKKCNIVECSNDNQCEFKGNWYALQTHLHHCQYRTTKCYGCCNYISNIELSKHLNSCVKFQCRQSYMCSFRGNELEYMEHYKICQYAHEQCKFCRHHIIRSELVSHANYCETEPLDCKFCIMSFPRNELNDHLKICEEPSSQKFDKLLDIFGSTIVEALINKSKGDTFATENSSQLEKATTTGHILSGLHKVITGKK